MINAKKIERRLNFAKAASEKSNFAKFKLGCAIFYRGSLLAIGNNSYKTSPMQKKYNFFRANYHTDETVGNHTNCTHAEIDAITKISMLDIDFQKVEVYVYRSHKDGTPALARSCPACRQAMIDMGIMNIFYSTENGWAYEHLKGESK